MNAVAGAAYNTPNCANGANTMLFPVSTKAYNVTAMRKAFDLYSAYPSWLNNSIVLLEAYSLAAYRAVPAASTAYPDRFNNLLLSPVMIYFPGTGSEGEAAKYGKGVRKALLEGSGGPLYAYVNYARGDESLQAVYGYEDWRVKKLKGLKKDWDPEGKFDYYIPVD